MKLMLSVIFVNFSETHPLGGVLFENMVILELLKNRFNAGLANNL